MLLECSRALDVIIESKGADLAKFAGRIDTARIAVAGHSFGAATAIATASSDARYGLILVFSSRRILVGFRLWWHMIHGCFQLKQRLPQSSPRSWYLGRFVRRYKSIWWHGFPTLPTSFRYFYFSARLSFWTDFFSPTLSFLTSSYQRRLCSSSYIQPLSWLPSGRSVRWSSLSRNLCGFIWVNNMVIRMLRVLFVPMFVECKCTNFQGAFSCFNLI